MDVRPTVGARADGALDVHRDGAVLHVVLRGAVDLVVRQRDAPALWEALAAPDVARVDVDAGAVTFLDSSGLSVIVRLARDADERGVPLRLVATSERVASLLVQTGVRDWMAGLGGAREGAAS